MDWKIRRLLREKNPLIHCMTNPISIRDCANLILAVGARPMMAEHEAEVETITKSAGALLINLGNLTKDRAGAMKVATAAAKDAKVPYVLDLCGAAALENRRKLAISLINQAMPSVIKGNYSEIKALLDENYHGQGVDADKALTEAELDKVAQVLAQKYQTTVLASGKTDVISDGTNIIHCKNGTPLLAGITGTGCMQGALCAAFLAVTDGLTAAVAASCMMGICGQLAAGGEMGRREQFAAGDGTEMRGQLAAGGETEMRGQLAAGDGTMSRDRLAKMPIGSGSFCVRLMDRLSTVSDSLLEAGMELESVKGDFTLTQNLVTKRSGREQILKRLNTRLYFITDSTLYGKEEFLRRVEAALMGGVTILQLREKERSTREYLELAEAVHELTKKYGVPLIIDDRLDVAMAVDAEGVHLGQSDLPIGIARKLFGENKIIGATTKTVPQALEAYAQGADYLGVGAIFPTTTKVKTILTPVETLNAICKAVPIPVNAIGGLNAGNLDVLKGISIAGVCAVSAIMKAEDPTAAAMAMSDAIKTKLGF